MDSIEAQIANGIGIIKLYGDIDLASAPALEAQIHALLADGVRQFVVDMSGVSYCDSSGIEVLLRCLKYEDGAKIWVVIRNPHIRKIFELVRATEVIQPYETLEAAIMAAALSSSGMPQ